MIVYDREVSLETPAYFVATDFDGDRVVSVHDFLYAQYAMDGVDLFLLYPDLGSK
jgi:RNA polymerase sigma-70 factor (ECF subfamily)